MFPYFYKGTELSFKTSNIEVKKGLFVFCLYELILAPFHYFLLICIKLYFNYGNHQSAFK